MNHRINESAMLVSLNISQWRAYKSDKKISNEVAKTHSSDPDMGKYRKSLLAREALASLQKIAGAARDDHYYLTLPWTDVGFRILSSAGYFKYNQTMKAHETAFWNEFRTVFQPNYNQYREDARVKLNGLFNADEYPSAAEIEKKFAFVLTVDGIKEAADFRVDLGDAETARIKAEIETRVQSQIALAVKDIWTRLSSVVAKMSERLNAYTETENGVVGTFRDTLVTNIVELLDVVPLLNITSDPAIDQFCKRIRRELTAHSPEELRDSEIVRKDTARRADDILSQMSGYLA